MIPESGRNVRNAEVLNQDTKNLEAVTKQREIDEGERNKLVLDLLSLGRNF